MLFSRFGFLGLAASLALAIPAAQASPINTFTTGGFYSGYDNNFASGLISFTFNHVAEDAAAGNIAGSSAISNGTSTQFSQVFCVDLSDDIYLNTTYTASFDTTGTVKGTAVTDAGQIAWLLLNLAPLDNSVDSNEALQAAIWEEEYGSNFSLSAGNDATMVADYNADLLAVGKIGSSVLAADIAKVDWITPLNSNGSNAQAQVGLPSAPEPGGLVLLGTGLLGVAGAVRRRFRS